MTKLTDLDQGSLLEIVALESERNKLAYCLEQLIEAHDHEDLELFMSMIREGRHLVQQWKYRAPNP